MTDSALAILGLIIAGYVLFKLIGFIANFTLLVLAVSIGYWVLAPQFSWPLPF
jgi:hypothetical protein